MASFQLKFAPKALVGRKESLRGDIHTVSDDEENESASDDVADRSLMQRAAAAATEPTSGTADHKHFDTEHSMAAQKSGQWSIQRKVKEQTSKDEEAAALRRAES